MNRALATLILVPLLASTTWGVGCDLRCSLGQFPSSEQNSTVTGAVEAAKSPQMDMSGGAMPAEHCHNMARMTQMAQTKTAHAIVQANRAHVTASAPCTHPSCSHASVLVSQCKNIQKLHAAVKIRPTVSPSIDVHRVHVVAENSEFLSPSPPLFSLRL